MRTLIFLLYIISEVVKFTNVTPIEPYCEHNYIEIHEEHSTCINSGYIDYQCTECKYINRQVNNYIHSHIYKDIIITEPTCNNIGKIKHICHKCKDTYTEDIPKLEHKYKSVTIEPTYTQEGYTVFTCILCNDTYKDDFTPILVDTPGEWKYTDWEIKKSNSCTEDGYRERIKSRTYSSGKIEREIETDVLNKFGHNLSDWEVIKEPTCYEDGLEERTCFCGYKEENILPKLEHSFSNWQNIKKSTCWENGIDNRVCSNCQNIEERYLDKLIHNYKHISHTDSTTTIQGKDVYECEYCKHTYEEYLPLITNEWIYNIEQQYKNEINQADNIYKGNNLYIIEKEKSFYNSNHVHVAHIFVKNPATQLGIEFANGGIDKNGYGNEKATQALKRLNVPFLINCTGYDSNMIISEWDRFPVIYKSKVLNKDNIDLTRHLWSSGLYITQDGKFEQPAGKTNQEIIDSNYKYSHHFLGTQIVKNYKFNCYEKCIDYDLLAPRTAIGIVNNNEFYVIVASYYNYTHGLSLKQLANIFIQLNCSSAYNFDGGGSSIMFINNKMINVLGSVEGPIERSLSNFFWFSE